MPLTWEQVHAWRLHKQHLTERVGKSEMLTVVDSLGGLQAQLMSAAELQLAARVDDLHSEDIQSALNSTKTLVKTWTLRGTLHLITARDFPLIVAALSGIDRKRTAA